MNKYNHEWTRRKVSGLLKNAQQFECRCASLAGEPLLRRDGARSDLANVYFLPQAEM
jgi:hypothetical protein